MTETDRIVTDPDRMGGTPLVRGTRITVATVVAMVRAGMSVDEVIDAYPELTREDVEQSLLWDGGTR